MKKQDIENITIADTDIVKVVKTKNHIDMRYTKNHNYEVSTTGESIKKQVRERIIRLDKDTYFDPASETIKEYVKKEKRSDNESTFFRTKRELDWLIRNSFGGGNNEMMLTLTFTEKVMDVKELNKIFNNFKRRMNRVFKNRLTYEYILIREPHLDGSWHLHMLFTYEMIDTINDLPETPGDWKKLL